MALDYESASRDAAQAGADAIALPDLLKKALNEKFAQNPVVQERASAASSFLDTLGSAPNSVTPQATGGIVLSPTEQASLISSRRAAGLSPLIAANNRYDLMNGSIADIIGEASRAAQSQAKIKEGEADIAYKRASLVQKGSGTGLNQMLSIFRLLKPTAQQQTNATNAMSGLQALQTVRDILAKDPNSLYYAGNGLLRMFSPNGQKLHAALNEAKDVLTRLRTGAALNADEIKFYNEYLPSAFEQASTSDKLSRLESIYNRVSEAGQVPDLMDFLSGSGIDIGGGQNSDWEVVSP